MSHSTPAAPRTLPQRDGIAASRVVTPSGPWASYLEFLADRFPQIGIEAWQRRMARGDVLDAAHQPLAADAAYRSQQVLYYFRAVTDEPTIPFTETVIHQDELIVVADKPHFLSVQPAGRHLRETLLSRLQQRLGIQTLSPAHRIDLDTAGLVLFTVQPGYRDAYQRLFRERRMQKVYEAIAPWRSDLQLPMIYRSRLQERVDRFMQMHEVAGETNAETEIRLLERNGDWARYELLPHTGQKHQLRAHLNALGIPIRNDRIYPDLLPEQQPPDYQNPLQLLAKRLEFVDPITGLVRRFESCFKLDF